MKNIRILIVTLSFMLCLFLPVSVHADDKAELTFIEVDESSAKYAKASDYLGTDSGIDSVGVNLSKYGSDYIYNKLGKNERALWDGLDEICTKWYSDTENIKANNGYYAVGYVDYDGLTTEKAKMVANLFKYSRPQYYYLGTRVLLYYYPGTNKGGVSMTCYKEFAKGSDRKTATKKVEKKLSTWNKKVAQGSGDVAKEKIAHDLIVNNTKYVTGSDFNQSIYSVLVNGKSVCTGYATTFSMLMNYAGIDTLNITSEYHEWNLIKVDGTWYNVDVTFDDPITTSGRPMLRYDYFNRSDKKIKEDDSSLGEHKRESFWKKYAPSASKDSGSTSSVGGNSSSRYTIALNANGGYIGSVEKTTTTLSVTVGKKYGSLKKPARRGYTFAGWYTKKSGGSKVTSSTKVTKTKSHTLYAHWTKVKVSTGKIKSLKNNKAKTVTVTLKKISGVKGYKIDYATSASMAGAKSKTTTKTSVTLTGLKKGSTYYVKVCAYKKDSTGEKIYGKYSAVKKIKVSK